MMRVGLCVWAICLTTLFLGRLEAQRVDSVAVYEEVVANHAKDGQAWVRLGELYIKEKKLEEAKWAFEKALGVEKTARAYTGLGHMYTLRGKGSQQRAFQHYRMALGVDTVYKDALMGIARLHAQMDNEDAELAYLKVIQIDPLHKPAYRELILWYKDAQLVQSDALIELCEKYVAKFPDDPMGYLHLTEAQVERYAYDAVLKVAEDVRVRFPEDVRWLALEAQAHAVRGNVARAGVLFEDYLNQVADSERAYYEDISLIATPAEWAQFEATAEHDRNAFLKRFWETRKGALLLGGDGRRVEHYRRVWYARTFLGRKTQPWDKRGEVYIRYGEPNYRSRSGGKNALPPLAVQAFKEKKIAELFENTAPYRGQEPQRAPLPMMLPGNTYFPGQHYDGKDFPVADEQGGRLIPFDVAEVMTDTDKMEAVRNGMYFEVNPATQATGWQWEVMGPSGDVRLNLPPGMAQGIEPAVPIDRGADGSIVMPWESWIYLHVGEGKEFVFSDRYMSGDWDFPLVPTNIWHSNLVVAANNQSSAVQFMETASTLPEYFDVPPGAELLGFYYDLASFKSANGQTLLEVYFGIPPEEVTLTRTADRVELAIERSLVLASTQTDSIYRTTEDLIFRKSVAEAHLGGLFVELASIQVPPGEYILGVKLADRTSGKWGLYRQEVTIPSFADTLAMSDIEMAWTVSDSPHANTKFKKGDVWVVPAPTRSYETTRDARLYYEVYHLKQDAFGQAKYQVTYTIRPNIERGRGALGILVGGIRQMFVASAEPEFTVQYERVVNAPDEPVYFELETESLTPGLKMIEVQITDLNTLQKATRRAMFHVIEPIASAPPKDAYDAAFEEAMKGLEGN